MKMKEEKEYIDLIVSLTQQVHADSGRLSLILESAQRSGSVKTDEIIRVMEMNNEEASESLSRLGDELIRSEGVRELLRAANVDLK